MAEKGIFDQLVSGLHQDERQNLLQKLKEQANLSVEPLYVENYGDFQAADIEAQYARLPWYTRFWYSFLSLFKAKAPIKIFEDTQVSILGNRINEKFPGLYNFQKGLLLPAFFRHMESLKEAARFFYSALDMSVNRDRGAFFAFLGSLEMPNVHQQILREIDPPVVMDKNPALPEVELRQAALKAADDAMALINEDHRFIMYSDARSLNCLKGLSSFLFDRVLNAFSHNSSVGGKTCSANAIRELLISLNNILLSLKTVPSKPILESLFVFILQERATEPGFDINREVGGILLKAERSLGVIREFNRQVPLTWIIRCATRNMSHAPKETSGGEDWFVVYRDYWKRRIDSLYQDFTKDRRYRELLKVFRDFLKDQSLKPLENAQSESNPEGMPIREAFALSFLSTFYSVVYMPDLNKLLQSIMVDGEFQKKDKRMDYTEGYNVFVHLDDEIKKFDREISPDGDYGERYLQARQDMSALPVKRRKIQLVLEEVTEDAERILGRVRDASRNMVIILNEILGGETKGKNEVLSNTDKLTEKNPQFIFSLDDAIQQFQKVLSILEEIEAMETGLNY